ncbi:hypothetical protein GCM10011506_08040 [Marivirga lumbricoides]|uniref:SSD domain-containing protein n=1 Tax=Marivirga lumbricoides TaxID=1046115 RepID=A0ABQ1LLL5_9BACT|nr:hypothetical protein GCM10011506_08040 [Marivirga lumbricoides]
MACLWLISTAVSIYQLNHLSINFEFERLFGEDNEDRQFYEQHLKTFDYDNDYLIIILEAENTVFDTTFLQQVKRLSRKASELEGVESLLSPTEIPHLIKSPVGLSGIPLLHTKNPDRLASDSIRIYTHPLYRTLFADDAEALLVQLKHKHFQKPKGEQLLLSELESSLLEADFPNYRIVGKLTAQTEFINYIKHDFSMFLSLALLVTAVLLLLIYRSVRNMLLPYLISLSTLIYLLGIMASIGVELSILSVLIPPIILFVATSDGIHLLNAYRQNESFLYVDKLKGAVLKIFTPTLLTSVTTAIGFFSLISIPSAPVKELGIFAGLGVLIAFITNFILGPLLLPPKYKVKPLNIPYRQFTVGIMRNRFSITVLSSVIVIGALIGIFQLKTDAYLLKDLPEDSEIKYDFELVDQEFGGSKPWEMAIWPADSNLSVWDYHFLKEADIIDSYLRSEFGMQRLFSPVDLLKYGYQIERGGGASFYRFPPEEAFESSLKNIQRIKSRMNSATIADSSGKYARFAGFIPEWGSYATRQKNSDLQSFINTHVDSSIIQYRITGTTYLIDESNEMISWSLIKGLLLATALISIVLAFYFKSLKMLLISLVPNFIPLLITAGVMGFIGAPLKLTTAIIFAVAFGIAVDDTIHFLGAYKKAKATSHSWRLIKTFRSAGLSIVITSVLIIGGFILFTFSSFATTFYLGLFLSLAMLSALITDLFLLPLLLSGEE